MTGLSRPAAALALALAACSVSGAASAALRGTVIEFGRTEGDGTHPGRDEDAGTGLAPAHPLYDSHYVDHSDVIEARLCRSFGVTVRLAGTGPRPDRVDVRVVHPRFTRPDGATSLEDDFPSHVDGDTVRVGFSFDHLWEMQPGAWRIVVESDGAEITSKSFEVVASPPDAPKTDCRGGLET